MTNFEFIKTLSIEELAEYYCYKHDRGDLKNVYCDECPFTEKCHTLNLQNGVLNWLKEEHIEDKKGW